MIVETLESGRLLFLPQLGLIFVGMLIERHYVSRVTCFTNSLALIAHANAAENVGWMLGTFSEIALVFGVVGMWAYLREDSLGKWYYLASFLLFSGLPIGAIILFTDHWILALIGANGIALPLALRSDDSVVYTKSMPGATYEFAKNTNIVHTNREIGYRTEINVLEALSD